MRETGIMVRNMDLLRLYYQQRWRTYPWKGGSSWTFSLDFQSRLLATTRWKPFLLTDEFTLEVKKAIEAKWGPQVYGESCPAELERQNKNRRKSGKKKYVLSMFPYPSGKLHMGHVRIYTLSDVLARVFRLRGHEVVHPMGWDAFGLPAENAARDRGVQPEKWTRENIAFMRSQIINMGCVFDWEREIATCDPTYYKWTQWMFLKLLEKGMAYKKQAYVFWDPIDQTVLAEEQVDDKMRSWRSGAIVEKKLLNQWFIRTAAFAKDLATSLDSADLKEGWRDIILLQKHWIGPIKGFFSDCALIDTKGSSFGSHHLRLWFSSRSALSSANYVILDSNHYLVKDNQNCLTVFDASGVEVKQMKFFIKNPVNNEIMPVFSSDPDIMPKVPSSSDCRVNEVLNEIEFAELATNESFIKELDRICEKTEKPENDGDLISIDKPQFVCHPASLKLRDWLISRQRSWGTPIPALNCLHCDSSLGVKYDTLPILPSTVQSGVHTMPLCSKCGNANVIKETDTLDTFFDSSWYYLRYLDAKNDNQIFDPKIIQPLLPVDIYVGGKEHATLHLYYARFMAHFLHRIGLIPVKEAFRTLIPVGVVMGETYIVGKTNKYIPIEKVEPVLGRYIEKETKLPVAKKWEKMSKSRYNGVDPDQIVEKFGIDSTRLISMADVVPTSSRKWNHGNLVGFLRFQDKLWLTLQDFVRAKESGQINIAIRDDDEWNQMESEIFDARNYYLKGLTHSYVDYHQISVVISKLQGLLGFVRKYKRSTLKDSIQFERALGTMLIALYPITPAFSAQLWQYFREVANLTETEFDLSTEVWLQQWPEVDSNYNLELVVALMGTEVRVKVPRQTLDTIDEKIAFELALEDPQLEQYNELRDDITIKSFDLRPGFGAHLELWCNKLPVKIAEKGNEEKCKKLKNR